MKVRKGDKVKVIAGKFKGTEGEVLQVFRKKDSVVVEGVNVKKKTIKRKDSSSSENFVYVHHPIHVSNVKVVELKENIKKDVKEEKTKKDKGEKTK